MTPNARIPVSWGELIDKITILEIKAERLGTSAAVANALRELALLTEATETIAKPPAELADLKAALRNVNRRLWDIEDAIRQKEAMQSFDAGFIDLARAVYRNNDERTRIKRAINDLLRSDIVEEKQYAPYRSGG
jgi:hypothetical protein